MPRRRLAGSKEVKLDTVFEPDDGGWHVYVPSLTGCRTWGRSLTEARRNIREAISLQEEEFDDADAVARDAILVEDIRLPAKMRAALERAGAAKAKAETEAAKARAASLEAARKLTEAVSLRDAGELLGLSQEGVRKILKAG
jgi:predicted RNase H-like HicB family nuclease